MAPATGAHADGPLPTEWLAALADALETPLLLLDMSGGLIHANSAARTWLDGPAARWRLAADGRLQARRPADAGRWRAALAHAAEAASGAAVEALPGWRLQPLAARPAAGAAGAVAAPASLLLRLAREGE